MSTDKWLNVQLMDKLSTVQTLGSKCSYQVNSEYLTVEEMRICNSIPIESMRNSNGIEVLETMENWKPKP